MNQKITKKQIIQSIISFSIYFILLIPIWIFSTKYINKNKEKYEYHLNIEKQTQIQKLGYYNSKIICDLENYDTTEEYRRKYVSTIALPIFYTFTGILPTCYILFKDKEY